MTRLRRVCRSMSDVGAYALHSGHWWLTSVSILLAAAAGLAMTAKAVVGPVVYVLF